MIPKNIFQIYHDKNLIKETIIREIKKINIDYNYYLYNFNDGIEFVKNNFEKKIANNIIEHINNLEKYQHKSDLLRYCLLYIYGGVYLDIDLKQKLNLDLIINNSESSELITSFGLSGDISMMEESEFKINNKKYHPLIANGLLCSIPKNKILYEQILYILSCAYKIRHSKFIYYFHDYLLKLNNNNQLESFKKIHLDGTSIYLFKEITFELKGKCCFIDKNNNIIMYSNNYMSKKEYLNI
jgi:hypothetical protein